MIVMTGPGAQGTAVTAGGVSLSFKFLTSGPEPTPKPDGDSVVVGRQVVSVRDGTIVLAVQADR
jgi:hypothetical protein